MSDHSPSNACPKCGAALPSGLNGHLELIPPVLVFESRIACVKTDGTEMALKDNDQMERRACRGDDAVGRGGQRSDAWPGGVCQRRRGLCLCHARRRDGRAANRQWHSAEAAPQGGAGGWCEDTRDAWRTRVRRRVFPGRLAALERGEVCRGDSEVSGGC